MKTTSHTLTPPELPIEVLNAYPAFPAVLSALVTAYQLAEPGRERTLYKQALEKAGYKFHIEASAAPSWIAGPVAGDAVTSESPAARQKEALDRIRDGAHWGFSYISGGKRHYQDGRGDTNPALMLKRGHRVIVWRDDWRKASLVEAGPEAAGLMALGLTPAEQINAHRCANSNSSAGCCTPTGVTGEAGSPASVPPVPASRVPVVIAIVMLFAAIIAAVVVCSK